MVRYVCTYFHFCHCQFQSFFSVRTCYLTFLKYVHDTVVAISVTGTSTVLPSKSTKNHLVPHPSCAGRWLPKTGGFMRNTQVRRQSKYTVRYGTVP